MVPVKEILSRKSLAVLLDPEELQTREAIDRIGRQLHDHRPDMVLIGGSTWYENVTPLVKALRPYLVDNAQCTVDNAQCTMHGRRPNGEVPLVLFPGHPKQFSPEADAILFHTLLTSNKAETLIGWQTDAAREVKASGIEVLSMGYILVDGGKESTTARVTGTQALPLTDPQRIADLALAGEMLGLQCIYLEAGSGAATPVNTALIRQVRESIQVPLIVGGGIRSREAVEAAWAAGANMVVVGNWIEAEPERLGLLINN